MGFAKDHSVSGSIEQRKPAPPAPPPTAPAAAAEGGGGSSSAAQQQQGGGGAGGGSSLLGGLVSQSSKGQVVGSLAGSWASSITVSCPKLVRAGMLLLASLGQQTKAAAPLACLGRLLHQWVSSGTSADFDKPLWPTPRHRNCPACPATCSACRACQGLEGLLYEGASQPPAPLPLLNLAHLGPMRLPRAWAALHDALLYADPRHACGGRVSARGGCCVASMHACMNAYVLGRWLLLRVAGGPTA